MRNHETAKEEIWRKAIIRHNLNTIVEALRLQEAIWHPVQPVWKENPESENFSFSTPQKFPKNRAFFTPAGLSCTPDSGRTVGASSDLTENSWSGMK
ncbi:hypothetical protein J6590_061365 [Homalodisca vitripennis]|nr:hypothetical protein J6590_061365 [Homalodisca vitripennis]